MTPPTKAEARAHHYVPACWLAGFTETGEKSGRLWVTDLKRAKQWSSSPAKVGRRRDFYRVSDPSLDPVTIEKALSKMEGAIAPVLRSLDVEQRTPTQDELEGLLSFIAVQWARVPASRLVLFKIMDSYTRSQLSAALKSPESLAAALKDAGFTANAPGSEYDKMLQFVSEGYSLSAGTEWYMEKLFEGAQTIITLLRDRHWGTLFSRKGNFIGSDNPVTLDGPKGQKVGFENAEVVTYPVSRHVLPYGTKSAGRLPTVTQMLIARINTLPMLSADEQVYSHVSQFCWGDESGTYQTDWRLFSKKKYL